MLTTIQMNVGDCTGSWTDPADNTVYPFDPIPADKRWQVKWAREKAVEIGLSSRKANDYFLALGKTVSLLELLYRSPPIWIHYGHTDEYGWTNSTDIWICDLTLRWGRWSTLGTLIHELAHLAGAPGDPSKKAEEALLYCGLGRRDRHGRPMTDLPHAPFDSDVSG
jgi:hypothetical protein